MGMLNSDTVAECKALPRQGTVKAIDTSSPVFDVQIGETLHEDVPVHYHCMDEWKTHAHPHTDIERTMMMAAFSVNDEVLVLCDAEGKPVCVTGFLENPKPCSPIIVLFKQAGEEYDWWFWDIAANQGYHQDPGAPLPSVPEIITKWWSCEGLEVSEHYTTATPAQQITAAGGCQDNCGLIDFDDEECCAGYVSAPDDPSTWDICPCGGGWDAFEGQCEGTVDCGSGIEEAKILPGCSSTQNRAAMHTRNCAAGGSWQLTLGNLQELITVGPRTQIGGLETKNNCSAAGAICGPYVRNKRCCGGWDEEEEKCTGAWDPYGCGEECSAGQECTGWLPGPPGAVWRWSIMGAAGGEPIGSGCVELEETAKSSLFDEESADLETRISVGAREMVFEGGWSQYASAEAGMDYTKRRSGYTNGCQSCDVGILEESSYDQAFYSFAEQSYGVGGWRTVVSSDGRIAVLIPELYMTAFVEAQDGDAIGQITSTTTILIRIMDDGDDDFELAEAGQNYYLSAFVQTREELGIKPSCYYHELPLDIELRGFHWHETYNHILVAFALKGEFAASLLKKEGGGWIQDSLAEFKSWAEMMGIDDYAMFLH